MFTEGRNESFRYMPTIKELLRQARREEERALELHEKALKSLVDMVTLVHEEIVQLRNRIDNVEGA